jgi:hypothetical protein
MHHPFTKLGLLVTTALMASCATYKEPSQGNEAVLKNRPSAFASHMGSNKLITQILKIDGLQPPWAIAAMQSYKVSPGDHLIEACADSPPVGSRTTIPVRFKAREIYTLSAYSERRNGVWIHIYEIKDSQEKVITRQAALGTSSGPPLQFIPPVQLQ